MLQLCINRQFARGEFGRGDKRRAGAWTPSAVHTYRTKYISMYPLPERGAKVGIATQRHTHLHLTNARGLDRFHAHTYHSRALRMNTNYLPYNTIHNLFICAQPTLASFLSHILHTLPTYVLTFVRPTRKQSSCTVHTRLRPLYESSRGVPTPLIVAPTLRRLDFRCRRPSFAG